MPSVLVDARRDDRAPHPLPRVPQGEALPALLFIAGSNAFDPFDIEVSRKGARDALGDLAVAIGQPADFGLRTFDCLQEAQGVFKSNNGRLVLGALGLAILAAGPIGWAMAGPPGSPAARRSSADWPRSDRAGMMGGIATVGALASIGTGASVAALMADSVESVSRPWLSCWRGRSPANLRPRTQRRRLARARHDGGRAELASRPSGRLLRRQGPHDQGSGLQAQCGRQGNEVMQSKGLVPDLGPECETPDETLALLSSEAPPELETAPDD